jgi:hypothetical protein
MTRRRWIADEFSRDRAALTGAHAAHLSRTLRARIGQEFEVACGDRVRRAAIASITDDRVEFALSEEVAASDGAPIALLLAIFKFDRMEWAIEKCTELNVTTIVPVIARRTEKHLAIAAEKRVERWRRIAREASEQSRRTSPPEITDPFKLGELLKAPVSVDTPNSDANADTVRVVLVAECHTPKSCVPTNTSHPSPLPPAPRAAGLKMSCRVSPARNGSQPRSAKPFFAPKPPPSPRWPSPARKSSCLCRQRPE